LKHRFPFAATPPAPPRDSRCSEAKALVKPDALHTLREFRRGAPERLNHDPGWAAEAGINSVEILSYLKLALYRRALESWHAAVKHDHTPFFEFLYAALTGNGGNLQTSIEFLRDQPLDLVRWTVDNSRREDLRLVRVPELEEIQTDRLLPPSERGVPRTDENPWRAVQGDGGQTESDGVDWLLPYWMGRHYGFIQAPE
jgi:hypothetical protein